MNTYFTILAAVILFATSACRENLKGVSHDTQKVLKKQQIIKIANKFVVSKYELPLDEYNILFEEDNKQWNKAFEVVSKYYPDFSKEYTELLSDRNYQAIGYILKHPEAYASGGNYWVFIDKKTGEVIGSCGAL